jgi:hypothetical protein
MSSVSFPLPVSRDPHFSAFCNGERPNVMTEVMMRDDFAKNPRKTPETWLEHVVCHDTLWAQQGKIEGTMGELTYRLRETQTRIEALQKKILKEKLESDPMYLMDDSPQALLNEARVTEKSLGQSKSLVEKQLQKIDEQRKRHIRSIQEIQVELLGDNRKKEAQQFIENPEARYCGLRGPHDVFFLKVSLSKRYPEVMANSREHRPLLSPRTNTDFVDADMEKFLEDSRAASVVNTTPSLDPEVVAGLERKGSEFPSNLSFTCGQTPSPFKADAAPAN